MLLNNWVMFLSTTILQQPPPPPPPPPPNVCPFPPFYPAIPHMSPNEPALRSHPPYPWTRSGGVGGGGQVVGAWWGVLSGVAAGFCWFRWGLVQVPWNGGGSGWGRGVGVGWWFSVVQVVEWFSEGEGGGANVGKEGCKGAKDLHYFVLIWNVHFWWQNGLLRLCESLERRWTKFSKFLKIKIQARIPKPPPPPPPPQRKT